MPVNNVTEQKFFFAQKILTSVPRVPSKTVVNMLIVTIPLDRTYVRAGKDI